jgi:hypothetical protein
MYVCVRARTGVLAKVYHDVVTGAPSGSREQHFKVSKGEIKDECRSVCIQNTLYTNIFKSLSYFEILKFCKHH